MKKMTIGKRITAGFASVIIIALTLGAFSYILLNTIRNHSSKVANLSLPAVELVSQLQKNTLECDKLIFKHIGSSDAADMAGLEAQMKALSLDNSRVFDELDKVLVGDGRDLLEKTKIPRDDYVKARDAVLVISRQGTNNNEAYALGRTQMDPASDKYRASLSALTDFSTADADSASQLIMSAVQRSQWGILIGLGLTTIVGVLIAFAIIRGTNKILSRVAGTLGEGSNQVVSAAAQVSSASQTLAEGSSEQAASLEETSSSLEEMASMTKRNAENAAKANDLAKQARSAADNGVGDMQSMNAAMEAIKISSDDIAKIIKTIDEIAFQTNILALNAAVEAARAGEAGMGFAVVADEVRNLAQRSAQAAKETAGKIEGAISKTAQGVEISKKVSLTLNEIVTKARQVDELVAEVAGASREQTQGITQVNQAVGQMDKVTQSNAANAEESAAAAEELNSQAMAMKESVQELLALVGGAGNQAALKTAPAHSYNLESRRTAAAPRASRPAGNGHARPELITASRSNGHKEIPMDGDFKDF